MLLLFLTPAGDFSFVVALLLWLELYNLNPKILFTTHTYYSTLYEALLTRRFI